MLLFYLFAVIQPSPSSPASRELPPLGEARRAAEGVPTREKHPDARETLDVPSSAATFQALLSPYGGTGARTYPPGPRKLGPPPFRQGGLT